jgi:hypothetical protein
VKLRRPRKPPIRRGVLLKQTLQPLLAIFKSSLPTAIVVSIEVATLDVQVKSICGPKAILQMHPGSELMYEGELVNVIDSPHVYYLIKLTKLTHCHLE